MWLGVLCFTAGTTIAGQGEPGGVLTAGALSGAHLGATAALVTGSSQVSGFAFVGSSVGFGAAWGVSRKPLEYGVGARSVSSVGLGSLAGMMMAQATMPGGEAATQKRILVGSALGDVAGWGLGLVAPERSPAGWVVIDEVAFASWMLADAGSATLGWVGPEDRTARARLALGLTSVATGTALALQDPEGPRIDPAQAGLWMAHGAWLSATVPRAVGWDAGDRAALSVTELGAGLGWATGALLPEQAYAPPVSAVARSVAGGALGRGLPLLVGGGRAEGVAIVGMGIGELAGHLSAVRLDGHVSGDGLLIGVGLGWSAWQLAAWHQALEPLEDPARADGAALCAASLGLGATIAAQHASAEQRARASLGGSVALWSSGVTLLGARSLGWDAPAAAGLSLGAGYLGFGAGWGLGLVRPAPPGARLLVMHGGAILGGTAAYLASGDLHEQQQARVGLAGGLAGLTVGALLPLPEPGASARLPRMPEGVSFQVGPWTDPDGETGVQLGLSYARE